MAERTTKVRLSAQIQEYVDGMAKAAQQTREVGTAAEKLAQKKEAFQQLGAGLLVVGGAMTALSVSVMKTGIEYNSLQQKSRAALNTLLGSAQAANAQMDKLDAFARTSPFSKAVFISAQQQMLAFGIEAKKVVPYLDAIQNAVAASGGSNDDIRGLVATMSKIQSSAKLTATDLMEFGNRGVDAAGLIGASMGKTGAQIREEITAGSLDAGAALDALVDGMDQRFAGAADNVKQTFEGAMDRVSAAWRDFSADLAKPLVDPNGGGALVDFLNWTADMMRAFQALPEPIKLTGGAMFALAGFIALASGAALVATPRIVAMKVAFMTLSTTMRGIATTGGIAVLALAAVATVVSLVAAEHARAQQLADEYASALDQGAKAATRFVAEQLAMEDSFLWMSRGSAVDNAKKLGLGIDDVTKAVTGSAAEFEVFKENVHAAYDAAGQGVDAGYAAEQLTNKVTDLRQAQELSAKQAGDTAEATDSLAGSFDNAANSGRTAAEAYLAEADAVNSLRDELSGLIGKINEANGVGQDAVTTNARWQSALAGISEEVQKQKDAYEAANETLDGFSLSLDENTVSGSANAASLADVASAAQTAAEAQFIQDQQTMSADEATKKYVDTLAVQRQKFEESAVAAGYNAEEVQNLANKVFGLPDAKEVKILAETAAAQRRIDDFVTLNNGRTVSIYANTIGFNDATGARQPGMPGNANGGFYENKVKMFAAGGFEPGIYPYQPGGLHKFAEEYAEAYISLDPARQKRSEAVWVRTGEALGMFSGGGGGGAVGQATEIHITHTGNNYAYDPTDVAKQTREQLQRALEAYSL